jgi:PST family polysaccharide transporter
MGILSVFNSSINFIKTGAGLGISQSAVRDISEAYGSGDKEKFSRTINLTNKIVLFTSLLGLVVTVIMSPLLSRWGFGDSNYTVSFVLLGLAVAADIYAENQLAILKGMRRLRALALASIIGTVVALITGVPLFYIWGEKGIVPSILISAFCALLVSNYYVRQIPFTRIKLSFKEIVKEGNPMVKMGIALMLTVFLSYFFDLIIVAVLRKLGGLDEVGFYQAGATIITNYFGIVLTAMTTDYYPRISAVYSDNEKLSREMNAQVRIGLVMIFPLAVIFVGFASIFIPILYSSSFSVVVEYTDIALLGVFFCMTSNCVSMILLAKQDSKSFLTIAVVVRVVNLIVYIGLYYLWGLRGLGFAYLINVVQQLLIYTYTMKRKYQIKLDHSIVRLLILIVLYAVAAILVKLTPNIIVMYVIQSGLIIVASLITLRELRKMNINFFQVVKSKIIKQ